MRFRTFAASSSLVLCLGVFLFAAENKRDEGFVPLFKEDGVPKGWLVRSWDGDPAFEAMEIQMADLRYNPEAKDSELTGGVYRVIAPRKQVYRPTEWNHYVIRLQGLKLHVVLNGETIHDLNLDEQVQIVKRHDGSEAPRVKDRPRRGHIGFQELSRGGDHVEIRKARIQELD